jgi:CubicO group peptidase (beta-lactamase class C family)
MLGRIIEHASGRRAQQFITQNLLLPLGMNRTTWKRPNHDDWARPFRVDDDVRVADTEPLGDGCFAAMGGLWSCVSDLTRWVSWMNDAFPARDDDETGPLRRASRREMQQVQRAWPTEHVPASGEGDDAVPDRVDGGGYGFGLFVTHDTRFGHFVTHSGGLPGYGSNMRWLPDRGVGVIALGNATYVPMRALTRRMLELIDDHGLIPSVVERPSTALLSAAQELAVLLSDWTDDAANALFADNVALDEPYTRRARHVSALIAEHGPLTVAGVDATTAVSGRVTMRHADGAPLKIDLDLSPAMPPKLQFYEVVAG